jgi:5-methylcytosine-specific restriction endonuclease McrA
LGLVQPAQTAPRQQPWCTRCGARGVDVDHIVTIARAPHLRLEPSNLRTFCHSCHSKITQWEDNPTIKRNAQRGATVQGLPLDPTHPWAKGR